MAVIGEQTLYDFNAFVCMLRRVQLFVTPRTGAHQAPLSMEFSRQDYWSRLLFPPPGDLPSPSLLCLLHFRWTLYLLSHQGSPRLQWNIQTTIISCNNMDDSHRHNVEEKTGQTQKNTKNTYCIVSFARNRWSQLVSSVAQSCPTLPPHVLQHTRPPCPSPTARAYSDSSPLSHWCHPTISSSFIPFSHLQSFPPIRVFKWVSSSHQGAKVLEFQLQHQSFQWTLRTDLL